MAHNRLTNVFVYGSLLSGLHNHRVIASGRLLGEARIVTRGLRMIDLGAFPGLVDDPASTDPVVGEVYEVDRDTLLALDRLEGHPTFYRRRMVELEDGGAAWVYVLAPQSGERAVDRGAEAVPGGDWRAYYLDQQAARRAEQGVI